MGSKPPVDAVLSHRSKYAQAVRWHGAQSDQARTARRDLAEARIAAFVAKTLAAAPPLTDEQRTRLAELLTPVRGTATDATGDKR